MVASFLSLFPLLPQLFAPTPTASQRGRPCKHLFLASTQSPINTAIGRVFWSGGAPMLRGQFSSLKGQIQGAGRGKEASVSSGGCWPQTEEVGTAAQSPPASPPGSPARLVTAVAGCTAVAARQSGSQEVCKWDSPEDCIPHRDS